MVEGPFTSGAALDAGVGESRLRRSDLWTPFRGVHLHRDQPDDLVRRSRAALALLPPDAVLCHVTALRLLGVAVPWQLEKDDRVHVTVPHGAARAQRRGLMVHTTNDVPPRYRGPSGLAVLTPERTWRDLAADLDVDALVVLGDAMLRRERPVTTVAALTAVVERCPPGRRGAARLRTALPDLRPRTDSPMESRTRLLLVRAGLPCPRVNVSLYDASGAFLAMPDLVYPEQRIAIEYDGDVHRTDQRTWRRDVGRRERLQGAGWLVMTVTADDVIRHPAALVARVRLALGTRS